MNNLIDIIKGIYPGKFIERELRKKLSQRALDEETGIPFQTINAIIAVHSQEKLQNGWLKTLQKTKQFAIKFIKNGHFHQKTKQFAEKRA